MSATHTPEKLALKRAFGETIKGVGGFEASASHCRVGKSVLAEQASINEERFPAIDVIVDLEPLARARPGWPHVTRELCTQMGGVFVALPTIGAASIAQVHEALSRTAKEQADTVGAILAGASDQKFDRRELARAITETDQMIEAGMQLRAILQSMREE